MKAFATNNGVADWNITTKVGSFSGSDTEATLDEEYIGSVGLGNEQWYWTEADWMYEWTEALKSATALPAVFSVSWGWSEADQCTVDPGQGPCSSGSSAAYVEASNAGFAAATARGISILVASGDSGAHGRTDPGCSSKKTLPDWPTASPYVLAVGATQISNGKPLANPTTKVCSTSAAGAACAGSGTEIVASPATGALIASGGGFSNVAAQPAWQAAAVKAYLASGALLPGAGNFNSSGRGYPDVAALGHNVVIYQSGPEPVDGTSCSAPIFGGVIGLANAQRLAAGKKVLGFVNPGEPERTHCAAACVWGLGHAVPAMTATHSPPSLPACLPFAPPSSTACSHLPGRLHDDVHGRDGRRQHVHGAGLHDRLHGLRRHQGLGRHHRLGHPQGRGARLRPRRAVKRLHKTMPRRECPLPCALPRDDHHSRTAPSTATQPRPARLPPRALPRLRAQRAVCAAGSAGRPGV